MLSKVLSTATLGIDTYIVEVETNLDRPLPAFSAVGLPDGAVKESKDRVAAAIRNSGMSFPPERITVNLAPADIPIALGIDPGCNGSGVGGSSREICVVGGVVSGRVVASGTRCVVDCGSGTGGRYSEDRVAARECEGSSVRHERV